MGLSPCGFLSLWFAHPRHSRMSVPRICVHSSVLVSVMVPDPGHCPFETILISPPGSQVEVLVGDIHHVDTPIIAGVGVEDRTALILEEHTDSRFIWNSAAICSSIIVEDCSTLDLLWGPGYVIIKVEIAVE